ncbi:hypothetical protein GJAV_G00207630 [Gymnothorax javanicus]|nr:hypothetical protein GJAV_G00207630 [Gymnothorax javanicus]
MSGQKKVTCDAKSGAASATLSFWLRNGKVWDVTSEELVCSLICYTRSTRVWARGWRLGLQAVGLSAGGGGGQTWVTQPLETHFTW